jgi:hypothetical protein
MKKYLFFVIILALSSTAFAQKPNDKLSSQLRKTDLKLTFDAGSGSSKLMGVSENFADSETKHAKLMAMNFAVGFFYPGQTLERAPGQVMLTFWAMSKKPVFAENHSLTLFVAGDEIIVGDARYAARARENMEYLNFNIDRDLLIKIAENSNVQFRLGNSNFSFTQSQMRLFADLALASDPMN